jgi:phosphoglucosamine mutase
MRFGTDGIRGPAGRSPIDRDGARAVGAAAARWALGRGGVVLVGRDTRPSGDELAGEVMQGVLQAGGRPLDCGVLPTPALQAAVAALGDAGVMVTASHNPADDNGFKVLGPGGHKPNDAETADLESWLATPAVGCGGAVAVATNEAVAAWAATFARALGDPSPLRGRRVAVDCANGAAAAVRGAVGALLPGVEILWLSTGDGVINAGVGSEHPEALAARVRAEGLDAGFAVDGDGDRCVVVDEAGRVVPGDALLWRLAVDRGARRLVVTVMSNTALEASLPGVEVVRTPVGDRHVAAALGDAPVGGEESGHVLLAGGGPGGDGLLTGFATLAACWRAAGTVSAAMAPFTPFPRRLTKVVAAERVGLERPDLAAALVEAEAAVPGGRLLVRYSGTEPVLRVLVEGPDAGRVAATSEALTARLRAALAG